MFVSLMFYKHLNKLPHTIIVAPLPIDAVATAAYFEFIKTFEHSFWDQAAYLIFIYIIYGAIAVDAVREWFYGSGEIEAINYLHHLPSGIGFPHKVTMADLFSFKQVMVAGQ